MLNPIWLIAFFFLILSFWFAYYPIERKFTIKSFFSYYAGKDNKYPINRILNKTFIIHCLVQIIIYIYCSLF